MGTVCWMERTDVERHGGLRCKVPQMGGRRNANATPNSLSIGDVCTVLYQALEAREGSQAGKVFVSIDYSGDGCQQLTSR